MERMIIKQLKSEKEELEYKLSNDAFRTLQEIRKIAGELKAINNAIKTLEEEKC